MLQILLAWAYISWLSWTWGYVLIGLLSRIVGKPIKELPFFGIVCLAGLSVIAVLTGLMSLFIPLGGVVAQLIILTPTLYIWLFQKLTGKELIINLKEIQPNHWSIVVLGISLIVLLLILGASNINHPDSLAYHLQTVKWIANYKAVPGLVHLISMFGYQGLWYCLCAFFGFGFTQTTGITFINTAVLLWFLLFLLNQLNNGLKPGTSGKKDNMISSILFFLLLIFSFWSYGQVRLTATSLSPDFIASLYVWLVIYLFVNNKQPGYEAVNNLLVIFLGCVAITIKLSTLPVIIWMAYAFYRLTKFGSKKLIVTPIIACIITATPFIARNIITSGYLIFPAAFTEVTLVDWRLSKEATIKEKEYIQSFAMREHQPVSTSHLWVPDWLPVWWRLRSWSDKTVLITAVLFCTGALLLSKQLHNKASLPFQFSVIASIAGICFWFYQAPDPRFGFGFLIPVQGLLAYFIARNYLPGIKLSRWFYPALISMFSLLLIGYSGYRCKYFFSVKNIAQPAGTQTIVYKTIRCGNINLHVPVDGGCGNAQLPCTYYNDCSQFIPRGDNISDGFKSK